MIKSINRKSLMGVLLLGMLVFPSLVHAQFRKSTFLLGANYYNDDPQGVIGDFSTIIGSAPGVNVNLSYRSVFAKALFYRVGAGLDIGLPKEVEDTGGATKYTFTSSRIEVPAMIGFSLASGPGHVYAAVGGQFLIYNASLKDDSDGDSGETKYSLSQLVLPGYFVYGMEAPIGRGSNGFFEVQHSQASGIGDRDDGDEKQKVQLRPSYIRWNVGINYSF